MRIILLRDVAIFCLVDICHSLRTMADFIVWGIGKQNYATRFETGFNLEYQ